MNTKIYHSAVQKNKDGSRCTHDGKSVMRKSRNDHHCKDRSITTPVAGSQGKPPQLPQLLPRTLAAAPTDGTQLRQPVRAASLSQAATPLPERLVAVTAVPAAPPLAGESLWKPYCRCRCNNRCNIRCRPKPSLWCNC